MKFQSMEPPRIFTVGHNREIELKDCGRLELEPDEQVTFVTPSGSEYDVARKSWGYYATPSLNHRLPRLGLKPALVRSGDRLYLLLVEAGKEEEFHAYLAANRMEVVQWLNEGAAHEAARAPAALPAKLETPNSKPLSCPMCGGNRLDPVFAYDEPPEGETLFECSRSGKYYREIRRCAGCGHYLNLHQMDLARIYQGAYVDATYGAGGMRRSYERIMALAPEESDNCRRVERLLEMVPGMCGGRADGRKPAVLDVGSGLCVFLKKMKDAGWHCTALDPDPAAVEHARAVVGVEAALGDFMEANGIGSFDLITFNKVLEHVGDPAAMLGKSRQYLRPGGVAYVEVPDGESAAGEGPGREEFFIEHQHVFSLCSLGLLAARAGFAAALLERVREPSGKYTLRAFLQQK